MRSWWKYLFLRLFAMDLSSAILLSCVIAKPIKKPRRHGVVRVRQGCYCTAKELYNLHCYSVIGGGVFLPLRQRVMSFFLHICICYSVGWGFISWYTNRGCKITIFFPNLHFSERFFVKICDNMTFFTLFLHGLVWSLGCVFE